MSVLQIDHAGRTVRVDGTEIHLTKKEFGVLAMLEANVGIALTRDEILDRVWGIDRYPDQRTVDVHVRKLRRKVFEAHGLEDPIRTLSGYGYRFDPPRKTHVS